MSKKVPSKNEEKLSSSLTTCKFVSIEKNVEKKLIAAISHTKLINVLEFMKKNMESLNRAARNSRY